MSMSSLTMVSQRVLIIFLWISLSTSLELNLSSVDSIKSVSSTLAYDMMSIYTGNRTGGWPGQLPPPPQYYWWESGAMWGCLIEYWAYTNDSSCNDVVEQGLISQVGPNWDYQPQNETNGMGNDDQGFWAMSAMTAAELNFQNPPASGPQWLGLAQAVFNQWVSRYENEKNVCGGGLRWQVYFFNDGYTYKNSISNGCFFNLGARLAKYTGNSTYADWAETSWNWMLSVGLIQLQPYNRNQTSNFTINGKGAGGYVVWDGTTVVGNECVGVNGIPYTYNAGIWLYGAAMMYNYTNGSDIWANRTQLLLNATLNAFFPQGIAIEPFCEYNLTSCKPDMFSFKAFIVRWLAGTTQIAPFTKPQIMPILATSAAAAVKQCSGGENGRMCGLSWRLKDKWDGTQGAGQQMAAMEVVMANMIDFAKAPVTNETGGTSVGNPGGGSRRPPPLPPSLLWQVTRGDEGGAWILTGVVLMVMLGLFGWMCCDEDIPPAWKMKHFVANKRDYATVLERWRRFWLTLKDFLLFDIRGR